MKKYLIIGLGNIGEKYENTRHNIGFKVADAVVETLDNPWENESFGMLSRAKYKGRSLYILKPDTYMNLSGNAVKHWMKKLSIPPEQILVITDDIHLPFGTLRMKGKGTDAGHNGLKSIQNQLQTQQYPRLRFGIGGDFPTGGQVEYVLGEWNAAEQEQLSDRITKASEAVLSFVFHGITTTMNQFNGA